MKYRTGVERVAGRLQGNAPCPALPKSNFKNQCNENKSTAKLFIILLFLNNPFLSYSQPDYFLTEFDSGKVVINSIVPNANSVRIVATGGSWGLNLNENFTKSGDSAMAGNTRSGAMNYITPGFYYYNFQVNGVNTLNPNEKRPMSILIVLVELKFRIPIIRFL